MNHGLFARPRYEASFSPIALNVSASHEYTFRRFPVRDDDATVVLVTNAVLSDAAVAPLSTRVRIRVIDQNNQVVCDAAGAPAGRGAERLWISTSGANLLALYLDGCHRP